jgi:hypothetical protein
VITVSHTHSFEYICRKIYTLNNFRRKLLPFFVFLICLTANTEAQIQCNFNSTYKYLKGSAAANLAGNWMTEAFDDSGWSSAQAPFRYGDGTGGTLLGDMMNYYPTMYLRSTFNAFSIDRIIEITLTVNYDDGFVIWINGVEAMRQNAPTALSSASLATANHESGTVVSFKLDSSDVHLEEGENLLCIQGLNVSLNSSDFYFDMGISASLLLPEVSDSLRITFDSEAGFYDDPFTLVLQTDAAGYNIVYTLDGSNPQTSATAVQSGSSVAISVDPESTAGRAKTPVFIVRASLAADGFAPSRPITKSFIFIDQVLSQHRWKRVCWKYRQSPSLRIMKICSAHPQAFISMLMRTVNSGNGSAPSN